jgi:hypothetical protein
MSTREKLIKGHMGMLGLAEQLNNAGAACRRAGIRSSHYCEIKEAFMKVGAEGLASQDRGKGANRVFRTRPNGVGNADYRATRPRGAS